MSRKKIKVILGSHRYEKGNLKAVVSFPLTYSVEIRFSRFCFRSHVFHATSFLNLDLVLKDIRREFEPCEVELCPPIKFDFETVKALPDRESGEVTFERGNQKQEFVLTAQ